jgi:hypothetical protein
MNSINFRLSTLLIRPLRYATNKDCHPERSAAESKDLRLLFLASVAIPQCRINRKGISLLVGWQYTDRTLYV